MAVLDHRAGLGSTPGADGLPGLLVGTTRDRELSVVRPEARWQRRYVHQCMRVDAGAALLAGLVAYLAHVKWLGPVAWYYVGATLLLPLVWVVAVGLNRAYEPRFLGVGSEEFRRVARAGVVLVAVVAFTAYAANLTVARRYVLVGLPLVTVLSVGGRYLLRKRLHARRAAGEYMHRVVVVGHEEPVLDMLRRLGDARYHGLEMVAACLPIPGQRPALIDQGVPVMGGFERVADAVRITGADTVAVLASYDMGPEDLRRLAWDLEPTGADLLVAPSLVEVAGPRLSIRPVTGLPLLQVEQPRFTGGRRVVKSTFDRLVALTAVVVLSPVLLVIAAAIRLTSRGPVLFRQERVGKGGETFTMYKFRSMVAGAEDLRDELDELNESDGPLFKMANDPRITRVGRWLRHYSLDELPQLFNVAGGSMSLVGPRPPLPCEVAEYREDVRRRLLVKPGVTGLWQVSGRADLSWEESVRLDLRYVDNWTLAADLLIMWKTARAVVSGSGAY
jgi:exopolysaccharide biosynthesis polyprenyl glycosylphosphotransferase